MIVVTQNSGAKTLDLSLANGQNSPGVIGYSVTGGHSNNLAYVISGGSGNILQIIQGQTQWSDALFDSTDIPSVSYEGRALLSSGGGDVLHWDSGHVVILESGGGNPYLISDQGSIYYDGSVAQLDNGVMSGSPGLNYNSGPTAFILSAGAEAIGDSSGVIAFDIVSRTLKDTSGAIQFAWASSGVSIVNKVVSYNGDSTVGNGMTSIVGSVVLGAQTASISSTNLTAAQSGTMYRVNVILVSQTAGTSGTVSCAITYTDVTGTAHTINPAGTLTLGTGTVGNSTQGSTLIAPTTSPLIKYSTTVTAPVGTPKYNLYITVERLQ